jgi:hypothetical protein
MKVWEVSEDKQIALIEAGENVWVLVDLLADYVGQWPLWMSAFRYLELAYDAIPISGMDEAGNFGENMLDPDGRKFITLKAQKHLDEYKAERETTAWAYKAMQSQAANDDYKRNITAQIEYQKGLQAARKNTAQIADTYTSQQTYQAFKDATQDQVEQSELKVAGLWPFNDPIETYYYDPKRQHESKYILDEAGVPGIVYQLKPLDVQVIYQYADAYSDNRSTEFQEALAEAGIEAPDKDFTTKWIADQRKKVEANIKSNN